MQKIRKTYEKAVAELAVFAIFIANVNKALQQKKLKTEAEFRKKISIEFYNLLPLFRKKEADKLNLYKLGVDYKINLKKDRNN